MIKLLADQFLDPIDDRLHLLDRDGPLLTRRYQPIEDLCAIECLPVLALLDDQQGDLLDPFVCRETLVAAETLPASPDRSPFGDGPGIHNPVIVCTTKWTPHRVVSSRFEGLNWAT